MASRSPVSSPWRPAGAAQREDVRGGGRGHHRRRLRFGAGGSCRGARGQSRRSMRVSLIGSTIELSMNADDCPSRRIFTIIGFPFEYFSPIAIAWGCKLSRRSGAVAGTVAGLGGARLGLGGDSFVSR